MTYKSDFLNILDQRGFIHQGSDVEGLDKKLTEGVQSAYIGFDATAQSLHIGNLTGIMMLYWFQQAGHKPITLMGGGTSKVGDPSFKDESRKLLDDATISTNIEHIKNTCFRQFLKYGDGPTDALMVNNDDWLSGLHYLSFLRDYGRFFTVNRMLSFDSVKLRLERESPLTLLEFNYMVMQGYDFLELHRRYGTVLQMGGSDQWGNIINGVELGHKADQVQLFALTAPLLTTASGQKMGKTEKGAVWLNAAMLSAYDYWQYWRNVEDADVEKLLLRFTTLPLDEIARLAKLGGAEINEAKKTLAFEATKLCHGEKAAQEAAETARKTFEQGSVGADLPAIEIDAARLDQGVPFVDLLVESGLAASKGEARRLIEGGGARANDQPVGNIAHTSTTADLTADGYIKLSAGKKKHALVRLKKAG
ncbi:MAG: tyrosine--tRNA ligase [Micavibrio aeruginosavorus]|nr:tyrosine--tRNA ligase [Micavibrio aeruginosavorus]